MACRPLHEGVDWNGLDIFEGGLSAWSPSSWGRGLKCHVLRYTESCRQVALFMRAWIEIIDLNTYSIHENSRPLHEGVDWNFTIGQEYHNDVVALFTRAWIEMNYLICVKHTYDVALFTRAWIEIILSRKSSVYPFVALFMRAWIEISTSDMIFLLFCSRPLHEGVDWNLRSALFAESSHGRPLHEGVDWNINNHVCLLLSIKSPSSWGRGLKLRQKQKLKRLYWSPSSWGRGLKYNKISLSANYRICRPLHEGVDWNRHAHYHECDRISCPLHEGVDWNEGSWKPMESTYMSPSSRGRGLKSVSTW